MKKLKWELDDWDNWISMQWGLFSQNMNTGTNLDFLTPGGEMLVTWLPDATNDEYSQNISGESSGDSAILSGSTGVLESIKNTQFPETVLFADDYSGLLIGGAQDVTTYPTSIGWDLESGWGIFIGTTGFSHPGGDLLFNINYCEPIRTDILSDPNSGFFVAYDYRDYHRADPDSTQLLANLCPVPGVTTQVGYGVVGGFRTRLGGDPTTSQTLSGLYWVDSGLRNISGSMIPADPGTEIFIVPSDNDQHGLQMKTISFSAAGLIDGLQATGHSSGAGVSLDSLPSPELKNCVITDNFTNVVARGLSNPLPGDAVLGAGGNNWFDGAAKYDVANHVSSSGIKAEDNCWGPLIGGVPKFTILGMVDIIPWLGQEPSKNENGDITGMPIRSEILSVHPNPFNPRVRIQYEVMGGSQDVDIRIFDISGRYVTTLIDERVVVGLHDVEWNGVDIKGQAVSAGVYLYRVRFGGENEIGGKFTLVK